MNAPDKVKRISLRNFRGWGGERTIMLDADLVLLSAPNGKGKSSLIAALGRALGGVRLHDDDTIQTLGTKEKWKVVVEWEGDKSRIDGEQPVRPLDPDDHPGTETVRRATCFTQDPLDDQFEPDDAGDDTLLGFLAPFPRWLEDYDQALRDAIGRLGKEKPQGIDDSHTLRARRRRDDAARELHAKLAEVLGAKTDEEPTDPVAALLALAAPLPEAPPADTTFDIGAARKLVAAIEARLRDSPAHRAQVQDLIEQRDAVQAALAKQDEAWPPEATQALATWATGPVDLSRLLDLLTSLARRPERWTDPRSLDGPFGQLPADSQRQVPHLDELRHDVVEELAQVDSARAERARRALQGWMEHWAAVTSQRKDLQAKLTQIQAELDRLTHDQLRHEAAAGAQRLVERQKDLEDRDAEATEDARRRARWPQISTRLEVLKKQRELIASLRQGKLEKDVLKTVQTTMNAVMSHFVVAGIASDRAIKVRRQEKTLTPDFADKRQLMGHLSTGQRAQDALAWLLGTNVLLQKWLPHRLLLLDDLSTALDLTNLAAECALLRKFVYGGRNQGRKRQVILASHHDQLTHQIYNLLLPPEGFTMREVQLADWSMEKGPDIRASKIKPTRAATDDTRAELARALGRHLRERQ